MSTSPIKSFQYSDSFSKQGFLFLMVGVVLVFVSFAIPVLTTVAGLAIALGIANIVLYINKDVVKIFKNH